MPVSTADKGIYSHMESPRLWGVDCGFGGFCKGSWEKSFLLLTLMMLTSKINTFMIEFVQFIHCG